MLRAAVLLLLVPLLAGCSGPGPSDDLGGDGAPDLPEPESGLFAETLTAAEGTDVLPLAVGAGHGRLAATLVLKGNLPETEVAMNVSGPDGRSTEVSTGPILAVLPGNRPTVSFDSPPSGEWTVTVRLDSGATADYEVHWCADAAEAPGPQDNLACQRDY